MLKTLFLFSRLKYYAWRLNKCQVVVATKSIIAQNVIVNLIVDAQFAVEDAIGIVIFARDVVIVLIVSMNVLNVIGVSKCNNLIEFSRG